MPTGKTPVLHALRRPHALLTFPSRLPTIALDATANPTSWIQVALAGEIKTRKLTITETDLRRMFENFTAGKFPTPPTRICVDYDHFSLDPQRAGDGKAAGWIAELQLRNGDAELWALVEWTPDGAKAITDREYQFVSPAIDLNKTANDGEQIGPTLINAAITNVPQLQGMAPCALSRGRKQVGTVAFTTLGDDDRRQRVSEAIHAKFGSPYYEYDDYGGDCYLVDLFGDRAVFRKQDRTWSVAFAIAEDGTVTIDGEPDEVVVQYAPLANTPALRTPTMANTITLKGVDGKPVQVDASELEATELVKTLKAKVPVEGQVVVAAAEHQTLTQTVSTLSADVATLKADNAALKADNTAHKDAIALRDATDAIEGLIRARKLVPAQRDEFKKLFLKDREMFTALSATLPIVGPELDRERGSGDGEADPQAALTSAAATLRAANPKLTPEQAYVLACEQHPALAYQDTRK